MEWQQSPFILSLSILGLITLFALAWALFHYKVRDLAAQRKKTEFLLLKAQEAEEAANRAKTHFVTNISHEIRTPLNAIVGMTEMLRQTPLNSNQIEMLNVVANSSSNLVQLINNILDFANLEAGNLTLKQQTFDLIDCLNSAIDSVSQEANKKQLKLAYHLDEKTPTRLVGDPVRLRQIVINLLDNSLKFTEEGTVELLVGYNQEAENVVLQFTVQDSGIGIDTEQIPHIFSPFRQADGSMTRVYGGNGLGLAICKRLVEMMGGNILVNSDLGQGTAVHFTARFGLATDAQPPTVSLQQHKTTLAHKRLLVITQDAGERRHISKEARTAGLEVYAASSAPEASYWIDHSQRFDVVLLDTAVWQKDPSILTHLQYDESHHPLPVILLVPAGSDQPDVVSANARLFSGTLALPIISAQLYDILLSVLSAREATIATHEHEPTMANRNPLNILIVEDNELNRHVLKNMLGKLGYQPDVAINGQIATQAAAQKKYDVILMDVQMPVMDGVEATQQILAACSEEERPFIIALTAHALEGDREYYLSSGMNEYISKPITLNQLVEGLYQAVKFRDLTEVSLEPTSIPKNVEEDRTIKQADTPCPPINLELLAQLVGKNTHEFLQMMTPIFLEDTQHILQNLTTAVQNQDGLEIRQAAHTLKGSSASMGMTTLSQLCRELEMMAKENELTEAMQNLTQIQAEFERVKGTLIEMVETAA